MTDATNTNTAGLELACELLNGDRAAFVACQIVPKAGLSAGDQEIADDYTAAIAAITGAAGELQRLEAERDALAARLAEIERAEPVAWIEHELQGTGLRHLHFRRRPNTLRDDVVAPVWTELIARPAPRQRVSRADELTPAAPSEQTSCRCELKRAREVLREAREMLIGDPHLYRGQCPQPNDTDARDPECPACATLVRIDAALAAKE